MDDLQVFEQSGKDPRLLRAGAAGGMWGGCGAGAAQPGWLQMTGER